MNAQNKRLLDEAYELYQKEGQSAVYRWASEEQTQLPWRHCEPCEDYTPHVEDVCAVCWTAQKGGGK